MKLTCPAVAQVDAGLNEAENVTVALRSLEAEPQGEGRDTGRTVGGDRISDLHRCSPIGINAKPIARQMAGNINQNIYLIAVDDRFCLAIRKPLNFPPVMEQTAVGT
jgi:hypothetical protein